jgi:hypothetical protein
MIESRTGKMGSGLIDLIRYMNLVHAIIVEVGSYKGDSALIFAQYFDVVYCVDAWEQRTFNVPDTMATDAEREFDRKTGAFMHIKKCKGRSLDVAKHFGAADVVYIDASHDYESVRADILAWGPHVHRFLCGHDYWPRRFPGVVQAVNELLDKPDAVFEDTSWVKEVRGDARS